MLSCYSLLAFNFFLILRPSNIILMLNRRLENVSSKGDTFSSLLSCEKSILLAKNINMMIKITDSAKNTLSIVDCFNYHKVNLEM